MKDINVIEFSEFPGPRYERLGPNSGEKFRELVLLPALLAEHQEDVIVNLDGTAGYGSSFLEEAFGGLIRRGVSYETAIKLCNNIISKEDESLKEEIRIYINEAAERLKNA